MIVVCINNELYPNDITVGEQYCLLPFSNQSVVYTIINNNGKEFGYIKDRFVKLEDWREQQINKILVY
jgi:hypothetical protein